MIARRERGRTLGVMLTAVGAGAFIGGLLAPGLDGWPELAGFVVGVAGLLINDRAENVFATVVDQEWRRAMRGLCPARSPQSGTRCTEPLLHDGLHHGRVAGRAAVFAVWPPPEPDATLTLKVEPGDRQRLSVGLPADGSA